MTENEPKAPRVRKRPLAESFDSCWLGGCGSVALLMGLTAWGFGFDNPPQSPWEYLSFTLLGVAMLVAAVWILIATGRRRRPPRD